MRVEVIQTENEGRNTFEIKFNGNLQYIATLPFVSIKEPLNLEKIRSIKINDLAGNNVYTTEYKYVENLKEQMIPMKYLVTGSQKFNQLLFISNENEIKIYYEERAIWDNRFVIEFKGKQYFCYSVQDGYIRHFPIYDGEVQIGEILKSNVVIDNKDEYYCYLKNGYEFLGDGVAAFLLYLDRSQYSSSYLVNKSYNLTKQYSYNKNNKYYDKEWVKNNFGSEFYDKVDQDVMFVKDKLKHPFKTSKEQWNSMSKGNKQLLKVILVLPWLLIFMFVLIALIIVLLSN